MPKDESAAHFYGSVPPGADMAERQGFEPWVTSPPHTRSRRANSTTLAPLRTPVL